MRQKPNQSEAKRRGAEAANLVARAKRGDRGAFDELVRKYRPRVYALALHLTGQASDADDITQDAFLKAYHKLPQFEGRSEFFTWIYRITLHRALNAKRDGSRRRTVPLDDPRLVAAIAVDAHGDPERAVQLRDRYRALLEAFDQLSPLLQTTVVLTALQGLSHKEAAVVLETTDGTVAWRIHEARRIPPHVSAPRIAEIYGPIAPRPFRTPKGYSLSRPTPQSEG
mgnify:CR=1 FL=1